MARGIGDSGPKEWLEALPPITRAWFLASILTTCVTSFGFMQPHRVVWFWPMLYHKFEVWRLVTPFVFFGTFSFVFLINMYILVQYSQNYEASPYNTGGGGGPADYCWMLILGMAMLLAMSTFLNISAPASGLTFMVMYVWSRRNLDTQVNVYGLSMKAVYLPWALLALNMIIGNSITVPLMGVAAGHTYYFCVDPLPLHVGRDVVRTPSFLVDLFAGYGNAPAPQGYRAEAPPARRQAAQPRAGGAVHRAGHNWGTGRVLGNQ